MATINRDQITKKAFNDFKNYPYGFARSGDFSIRESDVLSKHGSLIAALINGEVEPMSAEEQSLLAVARGEKAAESDIEKAWSKYQARINRPKVGSMYGRSRYADESFEVSSSDDEDLVVED
ncbi:DUF413 domain-containing protein [Pseudidiomarina terrestris]|uniref:Macrodomain Ori protein n=1 Tax=Pseudidiomarina terrestris TaxID=2820060 RepID=A0AAW7R252_9GAMM|nr:MULTISPECIES: DUF413 domain-containing protein [unclassified Pseudidiomarina]MDN7125042.1 DUF413 domain-containing protein [Pseudidiomarina sp. 1APP75-32.1]MDN7128203.1 DUF413 domain-containing protein [Pseudidiomarina sp. 1APR75-33.1]MDN7129483.1 DUF413 domain-containing protein [Pseudidiomarina sp. 1APR75-15]MDN7135799.1 DUF413 domain-containing protein [Pseudidiomarina sp. 1ASP75-5]MDN7138257.1 DUF413 domain-containing protein [Pseudidiomarina sp. 1ASP75-14]